jgi:hypothetical protein
MSPAAFTAAYLPTASEVSRGTGIDPYVLLAQWACETGWGVFVYGFNLGNIRCSRTSFCRYLSLEEFANACIYTWHNGYYPDVLAATTPQAQLAAICASPWDAGHYGGTLQPYYSQLEVPDLAIQDDVTEILEILRTGHKVTGGELHPRWLFTELETIKQAIANVQGGSGGLTDGQAGQLTAALQILTKIEASLKGA